MYAHFMQPFSVSSENSMTHSIRPRAEKRREREKNASASIEGPQLLASSDNDSKVIYISRTDIAREIKHRAFIYKFLPFGVSILP